MQLVNFLKNVRRLGRLELRSQRIKLLTLRATEAKNTALVATYAKETKRRGSEIAYLADRIEADLEDNPAWAGPAGEIREAVMDGSRGSSKAKALMGAAIAASTAQATAAATE